MDFVSGTWFGMLAPGGTPDKLVEKINADFRLALTDPDVKSAIAKTGLTVTTSTPESFGQFLAQEDRKLRHLVQQGVRIELQ